MISKIRSCPTLWSWALNNTGVNYEGPLTHGFFPINTCTVLDLKLGVHGCGESTVWTDLCHLIKGSWASVDFGIGGRGRGAVRTNPTRILTSIWWVKSYMWIFDCMWESVSPSMLFKGQWYLNIASDSIKVPFIPFISDSFNGSRAFLYTEPKSVNLKLSPLLWVMYSCGEEKKKKKT